MTSRTLSIDEYKQLITRTGWQRTVELRNTLSQPVPVPSALGEEMILTKHLGWATVSSVLDGVTITYKEKYSYVGFDELSLEVSQSGLFCSWTVEGVTVTDEAGARVSDSELGALLCHEFSAVDYSQLGLSFIENVDPEIDPIVRCTLLFHNRPGVRFTGNLIAGTCSSPHRKDPSFSGVPGKWYENELFITRSGRYVCTQTWRSLDPETDDLCLGAVCDLMEDVIEFFGKHPLSLKLYQQAGKSMLEAVADVVSKMQARASMQPGQ